MKSFAIAAFCLTINLPTIIANPAKAIPMNTAPASNIIPARWEPIARINSQKPYKIQLINQTDISLEYSSTTNEFPPRQIKPGGNIVLTQLPLPVYLLISPTNPGPNLRYSLLVQNNIVTVKITLLPENNPGNTTINIQETGGIYIY
jgi:hypothetical protein